MLVVVGGTIPKPDVEALKEQGVAEIFTPGAPVSEIVEFLQAKVPAEAVMAIDVAARRRRCDASRSTGRTR